MRRILASFVLGLCTFAAQAQPALVQQQEQARKQQAQLRERIEQIQKDIDQAQAEQRDATEQLKTSETAISDINRRLNDLQQRRQGTEQQLEEARRQQKEQQGVLQVRRQVLAEQLRGQYASGLSPWAALLSGDDPQDIARELRYLGYVNRSQAQAVLAVEQSLKKLAELEKTIAQNQQALGQLEEQAGQERKQLQQQLAERQKVLARIQAELKQQQAQASQLQRNDKRLGDLITRLDGAIAEQRERERREAERRKVEQARLAREKAERERQQRELAKQQAEKQERQRAQEQAQQDEQQDEQQRRQLEQQEEQEVAKAKAQKARIEREQAQQAKEPVSTRVRAEPSGGFTGLTKGLPYPLRPTEVIGRFGAQRPEGGLWRGVVLRAIEGTPVKAVAPGRVVYASWLSGFGNILIVDHGQNYLSVYAYNQALLKQVGDIVAAGDRVASVGATGGQVESGLYFEIRHQGAPINPLLWLK